MTREKRTGGCLCGAVRYEIEGPLPAPSACHCAQCRRQHGALGVYTLAPTDHYRIKGGRHIVWYESSPGIRRGFCKHCGSKLFWERADSGQLDVVVGTMDPPTRLKIEKNIFLADAGDYYDPPSR